MLYRFLRRLFDRIIAPFLRRISGAPTILHALVTMNDVNVSPHTNAHCHLLLGRNVRDQEGFVLDVIVSPPTKAGQMEFVQLVKPLRTRTPGPNGSDQIYTSNAEWVLDGSDPYGNLTVPMNPNPGGRPPEAKMEDTPSSTCVRELAALASGAYEIVSADDKFCTFIMWRPNLLGGRWRIPLGHITWHWDGIATIVTENEHCSCVANSATGDLGKWLLSTPADHKGFTKNVPNMRKRPRWQRTLADIQWRDV